ncbi:MarR family winged helix-turn-helix transcriptional regulator [Pseudohalioglobus lutimaris]|uniref:MarR family transcriptional regulator n=1 Tax=Pseudohalioglobus lutimaris TaxID=1737061 RepID=A0A2N5X589_9GAMM|nr:MarR family transcriptional regulator [Pseudohalioglobus lutimaris]PLW69648.1 MarR family transcriptional regulator [Pseudohalioglobus lutimaris]
MSDFAHSEARYLALVYRQLMRHLDEELAPADLGPGRYLYLYALQAKDGRRQQELADALGLDKAAVTRALARLEEDGFIRREADKEDGRATRVFLTSKGRAKQAFLEGAASNSLEKLLRPLTVVERERFGKLLAKIALPLLDP